MLLGTKAAELGSQLVTAELAASVRANFERDWRDDNLGPGFAIVNDPSNPEFYGFPDAFGSMTRADSDHFCLGQCDSQIENYNAQCQQIGAIMPGYGLIYFDRLTLELIYTAPLTPNAEYHYGSAAQIAFLDVTDHCH